MIFVLGAHGFVGSAVCSFLEASDLPHVGITLENYADFVGEGCSFFINAGGNSNKRLAEQDPLADFEMNVTGTLKTLNDFRFDTYLHLSSIDVYANTADPNRNSETAPIVPEEISRYGLHKWLGEQVVRRYARRFVIFRLGGMFGKNSRKGPAHDILHGSHVWVSPKSRFLFLDTATVAALVWKLRERTGEVFNLTASDNLSLEEFASIVGKPIGEVRGDETLSYLVNVEKASRIVTIPSSRESVRDALRKGTIC